MVWWRNRNEGFEWKTYVRTTILVRRGERRRKVEGLRHAAVDGLKMAGQRGVEAGLAGTAAAGSGTWSALKWAGSEHGRPKWIAARGRAWQAMSPQLIPPLTRLRLRLAEALAPAIEVLLRPLIYVSVAIVGWVFGIGGLLRLMRTGLDDETVASLLIAAAALVLTAGVRLLSGEASPLFKSAAGRELSDRLRAVAASRGGVLAIGGGLGPRRRRTVGLDEPGNDAAVGPVRPLRPRPIRPRDRVDRRYPADRSNHRQAGGHRGSRSRTDLPAGQREDVVVRIRRARRPR